MAILINAEIIEIVLKAYRHGLFPMAASAEAAEFSWYEAPRRGLLPLPLHVPQRLRATIRRGKFDVTVDRAFTQVLAGCARLTSKRTGTWINRGIQDLFETLHQAGHAHSVECWRDGKLAGGIYGLAMGGAFCAESMFSEETDASKVALVYLAACLQTSGFTLFDTQLINPHLLQFGAHEVSRDEYLGLLARAAARPIMFNTSNLDSALR